MADDEKRDDEWTVEERGEKTIADPMLDALFKALHCDAILTIMFRGSTATAVLRGDPDILAGIPMLLRGIAKKIEEDSAADRPAGPGPIMH